jgi:hypothetical protein
MMVIAIATVTIAAWRKQFGAAFLLLGAAIAAVQHIRAQVLLGVVTVIVGSSVLDGTNMSIGRRAKPAPRLFSRWCSRPC